MEKWKDIEGYEGVYQVSNYGNVKSLDRIVNGRNNSTKTKRGVILKQCDNGTGRYQVSLYDKNMQQKQCLVHRLVAMAFLDNKNNYNEINHKDECPSNNYADNLEWCTRKYNINYGSRNNKSSAKRMKKCIANSLTDGSVIIFNGIVEVEKKGFSISAVSDCLSGKRKTYAGYWWIYAKDVGKKGLLECIFG